MKKTQKFKSPFHLIIFYLLAFMSISIIWIYLPLFPHKFSLYNIFSISLLTLSALWASTYIRRYNLLFSITGGVTFAATLLYGVEGGLLTALIEVFIQFFRTKRGVLSKLFFNFSLILIPVFCVHQLDVIFQHLAFSRLLSDLLLAIIYWLIEAIIVTIGFNLYYHTPFLESISGPVVQSIDTFLLALMVGGYSSRLVAAYGPGYLIPIFISLFALIRLLRPQNKYEEMHQKILKNIQTVKTFQGFRDTVLRVIVNEVGVAAAAIVIDIRENTTSVFYGDFSVKTDIENHLNPANIRFPINERSYLVIVYKKIGLPMNREETEFFQNVSRYIGISIENIELIQQLTERIEDLLIDTNSEEPKSNWLRNTFIQVQEQERQRIASDLHDTTMQDLLFATRDLRAIKHGKGRSIEEIAEHLEIVNASLRETCFNLFPPNLSEMGLIAAIRHLIVLEQPIVDFMINFKSETNAVEIMSLEAKRDFFRIVQELISNAKKHMTGDTLELTFGETQDYNNLFLRYIDNGVGLKSEETFLSNIEQKGFGLLQIKNRILNLNGSIEISSKNGLEVYITVPLSISE